MEEVTLCSQNMSFEGGKNDLQAPFCFVFLSNRYPPTGLTPPYIGGVYGRHRNPKLTAQNRIAMVGIRKTRVESC